MITLSISAAAITDLGCKRKNNEDSFLCMPEHNVFCVADGMGGAREGQVASRALTDALVGAFSSANMPSPDLATKVRLVKETLQQVNRWIKQRVEERGYTQMGSTVVMALFDDVATNRGVILHAGDSRMYCYRDRNLKQLTTDHSFVTELGAKNEKSLPAEFRGVVTKAVGLREDLVLEETPFDVQAGDILLICSDGLTRMLSDKFIQKTLRQNESTQAEELARLLVREANIAGGDDNVTVIAIRVSAGTAADDAPTAATDAARTDRGPETSHTSSAAAPATPVPLEFTPAVLPNDTGAPGAMPPPLAECETPNIHDAHTPPSKEGVSSAPIERRKARPVASTNMPRWAGMAALALAVLGCAVFLVARVDRTAMDVATNQPGSSAKPELRDDLSSVNESPSAIDELGSNGDELLVGPVSTQDPAVEEPTSADAAIAVVEESEDLAPLDGGRAAEDGIVSPEQATEYTSEFEEQIVPPISDGTPPEPELAVAALMAEEDSPHKSDSEVEDEPAPEDLAGNAGAEEVAIELPAPPDSESSTEEAIASAADVDRDRLAAREMKKVKTLFARRYQEAVRMGTWGELRKEMGEWWDKLEEIEPKAAKRRACIEWVRQWEATANPETQKLTREHIMQLRKIAKNMGASQVPSTTEDGSAEALADRLCSRYYEQQNAILTQVKLFAADQEQQILALGGPLDAAIDDLWHFLDGASAETDSSGIADRLETAKKKLATIREWARANETAGIPMEPKKFEGIQDSMEAIQKDADEAWAKLIRLIADVGPAVAWKTSAGKADETEVATMSLLHREIIRERLPFPDTAVREWRNKCDHARIGRFLAEVKAYEAARKASLVPAQ